jgi:two-component system, NtrC family, nitrogen regulation sensor histidine kinase NtrY
MTFRLRLLLSFTLTVVLTAVAATWIASVNARRAFEKQYDQRTAALVAQFRREFARRGEEVVRRVEGIAAAEGTLQMAVDLSRPQPDYSPYVNEAANLAQAHALDFLELIAGDGTIISSAQWPARFGYKVNWAPDIAASRMAPAFLTREDLPNEAALTLVAVRAVSAGEGKVYIVAGHRLDREFLASLTLPTGMRALLYRNLEPQFAPEALIDANGPAPEPRRLAPLIEEVRALRRETSRTLETSAGPETLAAIPLTGREQNLLGVLLVGNSRQALVALANRILWAGLLAGCGGVLLGVVLSLWMSSRITRPVERLAEGAREVAGGNWNARVDVASSDELGQLAEAFNIMTRQILDNRDRLVQAERVAAWRELARRLAHELKNPLFPLQITIENLQRARDQAPDQFDEVFRESTATLLAELSNLKAIIGRFSDFAKMPAPHLESVDLNELVRGAAKLFEARFQAPDRPPITCQVECADNLGSMQADPDQIRRALNNLLLNAIDAMPDGGVLQIRTASGNGRVQVEVADTGQGLTKEECDRLFTPYYTTKKHGTGLGLAIVQSVVADHHGKISVESEPGRGTTFRIELPREAASA